MKNYSITAAKKRIFTLSEDEKNIGTLAYDSWFSFKATISMEDGSVYQVVPKGFWGTTIEVKQAEQVLIDFRMNWKGQILLHARFNEQDQFFIIKQKGFVKNEFVLLNSDDEPLLHLKPDFKWKAFDYNYGIVAEDAFEALAQKELMLLVSVHCANYFITVIAAAAS